MHYTSRVPVKRNDSRAVLREASKALADGKLTKAEWTKLEKQLSQDGQTVSERRTLASVARANPEALTPAAKTSMQAFLRGPEADSFGGTAKTVPDQGPLDDPGLPRGTHAQYAQVQGELFVGGAKATDVVQGTLGDCYLLAPLCALAQQRPDFLKSLVREESDGTFVVTLHLRGRPQEVRVDADLPVNRGGFSAARSTSDRELWPAIVEKAVAQALGSYQSLALGGDPSAAITLLTGQRALYQDLSAVRLSDHDKLFADLREGLLKKRDIVVAGTATRANVETLGREGLVPGHAYAVLAAFERDGEKMVRLRNPFGEIEPKGDEKHDGVFDMHFEKFMSLFTSLDATYG